LTGEVDVRSPRARPTRHRATTSSARAVSAEPVGRVIEDSRC
jgi:hypothetical protein